MLGQVTAFGWTVILAVTYLVVTVRDCNRTHLAPSPNNRAFRRTLQFIRTGGRTRPVRMGLCASASLSDTASSELRLLPRGAQVDARAAGTPYAAADEAACP